MRTLSPVPEAILDRSGHPRFGSYSGKLPRVDIDALSRSRLFRLAHHKRWVYTCIASDEVLIALAVVNIGYAASTFVYAFDTKALRMLADHGSMGPFFAARVSDTTGEGCSASYKLGGASVRIEQPRGATALSVDARLKSIEVHARLETRGAPPAIAVIAPLADGLVNMTEKRALLDVSGEATIGGRRFSLDGALAGYDYTNGLLARRTTWRWAFALGRAKSGERVGLNVVQGFVGEAECAAWIDGELFPLAEGRFELDPKRPLSEWKLGTADGGLDLRFQPGGMHAELFDYKVITSRFIQPVGVFSGKLRIKGRSEIELAQVPGVAEDQDMLW